MACTLVMRVLIWHLRLTWKESPMHLCWKTWTDVRPCLYQMQHCCDRLWNLVLSQPPLSWTGKVPWECTQEYNIHLYWWYVVFSWLCLTCFCVILGWIKFGIRLASESTTLTSYTHRKPSFSAPPSQPPSTWRCWGSCNGITWIQWIS